MSARLKGFIFGAVMALVTPALALQGNPDGAAQPLTAAEPAPYFRLSYADAEEALGQALSDRGAGGKISATITNRNGSFIFSYSQPISVEIRSLKFDNSSHRFTANLVSVSGKDVISVKAITGRFDEMVEVPVLKRSVRAGEVISKEDVEVRDYLKSRARADIITDMATLIGKSPERVISSGRPIRTHELERPSVVKKNDLVKMIYSQGPMEITTTGQAMSDGKQGAVISVKNLASSKIVQGTVRDASTIIIGTGETVTSSLNTGAPYEN